tara:strand:+ start:473347 stop:474576 length:1230 start_codon:yes stop_codon:yes gene_type:complete
MKSFVPLIRSEWRLLLFGFVMTFGSSLGQTYFIGLFSGEIRADLGLSHAYFGAIYSGATLLSAVILLWSGALIDKMDLRHYSYLVAAGLAAGCLMLAFSTSAPILFLSILVLRHLGQGLMGMAGATTVVRYLDHQKGKANALSGMGYTVAEAVLPSVIIAALLILGWRDVWLVCAVVVLAVAPLCSWRLLQGHSRRHAQYLDSLSESSPASGVVRRRQWTRAEVLQDPQFYLFMPALLAQPMLFTGFMFHQVHLVQEKGWDITVWGMLYLVYAGVSIVFKLWAGLLVDRFGAVRLAPWVCLPLGLGLMLLSLSSSLLVAVLFMSLMAVSIGIYSTLSSPFFSEMYGTLHLGAIKSVTTAAMVLASAIAPVLMGALIDVGVSMDAMAIGSAVYALLASGLAAWAVRQRSA